MSLNFWNLFENFVNARKRSEIRLFIQMDAVYIKKAVQPD